MTTIESLDVLLNRERVVEILKGYDEYNEDPKETIENVLKSLWWAKDLKVIHGKVTSCIVLDNGRRIHIRRPDISTHDITRGVVPWKDQTINLINNTILRAIGDTMNVAQIPQSEFGLSDQSPITVQYDCEPFNYEHVLRGYIAKSNTKTSLYYRYFNLGMREFCGHIFPDGLIANQKLDRIYDTPSTKEGHDMSVPASYLYAHNIVDRNVYEIVLLPTSIEAYEKVAEFLSNGNIELVDTKLEFGVNKITGEYCAMDELFTLDSSRFWLKNPDGSIMEKNGEPVSFSKQFARDLAKDQEKFTKDQLNEIAVQYILSTQLITGKLFDPLEGSYSEIVKRDLQKVCHELSV